ncbi:MAG: epoxyqueuosine reductase [Angelakisella sp.]|nr:epoxyqueuosine reductase [Angelakisella sp.]
MTLAALLQFCKEAGLADAGFFTAEDAPMGLKTGISLVAKLSDAVVEEITDKPTHSYFHHYRTVNAYLDHCMLRVGFCLQSEGWKYLPVGASQSIPTEEDPCGYHGRYSHKKGACLAGLGAMGKSGLFLHRNYGPRVRLGTIFTNMPMPIVEPKPLPVPCGSCTQCTDACPAHAIKGNTYGAGIPDFMLVDPCACSTYMKEHFKKIGRGAVCGVCMRVCPRGIPCIEKREI